MLVCCVSYCMCEMYMVYSPLQSISFAVPLSSLTAPVDLPLLSDAYMYASATGELFVLSSSFIVKVLPASTLAGNTQKHKMIKIIFIVCKGTMSRCCQSITTNRDLGWQKLRQMGIGAYVCATVNLHCRFKTEKILWI